jgi:hypothetical protein
MEDINIPSSLTSIGTGAFRSCERLETVTIPATVTSLEKWAFLGCEGITAIAIPFGAELGERAVGFTYSMIPFDITVVYYKGAPAVTAVANGTDIELTIHMNDVEKAIVGTEPNGDDVAVSGSGSYWMFVKQTEDVYYLNITGMTSAGSGGYWWVWVLSIAVSLLFIYILTRRTVTGTVVHDEKGEEGVVISYTLNGKDGTVTTDADGRYVILASYNSEFTMTSVAKENLTVSECVMEGKPIPEWNASFVIKRFRTIINLRMV